MSIPCRGADRAAVRREARERGTRWKLANAKSSPHRARKIANENGEWAAAEFLVSLFRGQYQRALQRAA